MIKIIVCIAMERFNCADSFMLSFVNNCPSDKPFGRIGIKPKLNSLSHSLFVWIIEIIAMAIIAVEKRQRVFIAIHTYKIKSIIKLRKPQ